jgi:hypothetical protein
MLLAFWPKTKERGEPAAVVSGLHLAEDRVADRARAIAFMGSQEGESLGGGELGSKSGQ